MIRHLTLCISAALLCVAAAAQPAAAQFGARPHPPAVVHSAATPQAVVDGVVLDDAGRPLAGAVVSAFGPPAVFAVSDPEGRFSIRSVPYGPYVIRAHLQGYVPPRARLIQVDRTTLSVSAIALTRRADDEAPVPILAAGVGGVGGATETPDAASQPADTHDHGEVAWRLRHMKRSVLKDAAIDVFSGTD
ncbi:MAG: carboxypeptidase-like regulatory domain-containing protein, partial [Solimonas sp.]